MNIFQRGVQAETHVKGVNSKLFDSGRVLGMTFRFSCLSTALVFSNSWNLTN